MFQNNNSLNLYQLIQDCWLAEPTLRPNFETIITNLEQIIANYSTSSTIEVVQNVQEDEELKSKNEEKEGKLIRK